MSSSNESPFTRAVLELGPAFAERANAHDRDGTFVTNNYQDLKARKLLSAGVPKDLGGGGATHEELCDMLRTLAHHCPSTALALSMHTHLVAAAVWRHLHGQPAAPLLQKVAAGELVLVSTGAGDWVSSTGKAERVDGGYRITSEKRFASGSPVGDIAVTSAPYDDPNEGPTVLHFAVPLSAEGVRRGNDWDTLGMRATGSNMLSFENVFVADAAIAGRRPQGKWHTVWDVIVPVAAPIYMSPYVGVAEEATRIAVEGARRRKEEPGVASQVGALCNVLAIAQMAHRDMIRLAANYDFAPDVERSNATLTRKTICANAVRECVSKAVELVGGAAFFRKHPIERLWRDVQGAQFHPLPEQQQQQFSGRVTLGLAPY